MIMVARGDVFRLSPTDKTCLSKDRSFSDFQGPNGTVRYRLVGFIFCMVMSKSYNQEEGMTSKSKNKIERTQKSERQ